MPGPAMKRHALPDSQFLGKLRQPFAIAVQAAGDIELNIGTLPQSICQRVEYFVDMFIRLDHAQRADAKRWASRRPRHFDVAIHLRDHFTSEFVKAITHPLPRELRMDNTTVRIPHHRLEERLKANTKRRKSHRLDEKHVCVSLSDPEAALSRDKEKVFCPLYTAQYMVDYQTSLVLGFSVAAAATDVGTLIPMIDQVQSLVGNTLERVCTDATYATVLELKACQEREIELIALVQENSWSEKNRQRRGVVVASNKQDFKWLAEEQTYECPGGHKLGYLYQETMDRTGGRKVKMGRYHCSSDHCTVCPLAASCVKNASCGRTVKRLDGQELLDAQRERMQQPEQQELLRQRGAIVERSIADTKAHRDGRRLHGRGLQRAIAEIGLKVMTQNLLTLHRLRKVAANHDEITS